MSEEHSKNFVWNEEDVSSSDEHAEIEDSDLYDRLFTFSVKQRNDEEESATATEGFTIQSRAIDGPDYPHIDYPEDWPLEALQPRLVVGEMAQAILHVEYIPEEIVTERASWALKRGVLEERLK